MRYVHFVIVGIDILCRYLLYYYILLSNCKKKNVVPATSRLVHWLKAGTKKIMDERQQIINTDFPFDFTEPVNALFNSRTTEMARSYENDLFRLHGKILYYKIFLFLSNIILIIFNHS